MAFKIVLYSVQTFYKLKTFFVISPINFRELKHISRGRVVDSYNTGVDKIQNYRQPMVDKLQHALTSHDYQPMTPPESTSPIVSFAMEGAEKKLSKKMANAGINIQLYENRFRISPSVYNSMSDIDLLINVLSG